MPHQCVRCSIVYEDSSHEILKGCSCGCKVFFYIKKSVLERTQKILTKLDPREKERIEKDIYEIMQEETAADAPVVLDLETVNVLGEGKFEIDITHLFNKNQPVVYKLEEGKYVIDLGETLTRKNEAKKEK